ncbi:MAG: tetratricopeptide repeat protein [Planctomycetes bacterium]|nr:tetratricopeptide repeat protein [Planctomycetota bacterium]
MAVPHANAARPQPMIDVELSRPLRLAARLRLWRPAVLVCRAQESLARSDLAEARACLSEAARRAPSWAEPYYLLGRAAAADESATRDEEESWLAAALERDPRHARAERALLSLRAWRHEPLMRGWRLYHAGKMLDALAAFDAAISAIGRQAPEATRGDALAGMGWCQHALGDFAAAEEAFAAALVLSPRLIHAQKGLGISLYHLGRFDEARAALDAVLALNPELQDARSFIGWCAYAQGRWREALDVFAAACAGNPLLPDPRWGMAWSCWRLGQMKEARAAFLHALRLGPAHPSREDARALFVAEPELRDLQAEALAGQPDGASARRELAGIDVRGGPLLDALERLVSGDPQGALERLQQALGLSGDDSWRAELLRGEALLRLCRHDEGEAAFARAAAQEPGRPQGAEGAARCRAARGTKGASA